MTRRGRVAIVLFSMTTLTSSALVHAQGDLVAPPSETEPHLIAVDREPADIAPITGQERIEWIVEGVAGPKNLGITAFTSASDTWRATPVEQTRAAAFARNFATRELDQVIARSVEAGLGAMWDEDPRPRRERVRGFWPKTGRAVQSTVLAPRADGHLAPAWARFAGYAASSAAANAWLPEHERTARETALRIGNAFVGQLIGNLWKEFWPDLRERLPEPPWSRGGAREPARFPR